MTSEVVENTGESSFGEAQVTKSFAIVFAIEVESFGSSFAARPRERMRAPRPLIPARRQFARLLRVVCGEVIEFRTIGVDVVKLPFASARAYEFPLALAHGARSVVLEKHRRFAGERRIRQRRM